MELRTLADRWRNRAMEFRAHACEPAACAYERAADELQVELRAAQAEVLTLSEAAAESGYSERRLREMVSTGRVTNAGRKGAPRIRRADLPRKASKSQLIGGYDPATDAQSLIGKLARYDEQR